MGTWGVLCCVNPGGDFLVIWGSWEPPWEDAEVVGATPGSSQPVYGCRLNLDMFPGP